MARAGPAWLLLGVWVALPMWLSSTKVSSLTDRIERLSEAKDLKKLLRTRNNLLVLYSKAEAAPDSLLSLLSTVAQAVKGQGTICWVDCSDAESRKLCKKMKIDPSSKDKKVELLHYLDGVFHMEYNRPMTLKSLVAFMKDPKGPPLWEEDPGAKDVAHIDSEKFADYPDLPRPARLCPSLWLCVHVTVFFSGSAFMGGSPQHSSSRCSAARCALLP